MSVEPIQPYLEPVRKSVTVPRPVGEAFDLFTAGLARWGPLATHSLGQARARTCAIEPRPGGEVYELGDDGERCPWGRVLIWEPPLRFVMTWHPGRDPDTAQEVEVRFVAERGGTRVDLEHRGWQKLGGEARETREGYDSGWVPVLARFGVEGKTGPSPRCAPSGRWSRSSSRLSNRDERGCASPKPDGAMAQSGTPPTPISTGRGAPSCFHGSCSVSRADRSTGGTRRRSSRCRFLCARSWSCGEYLTSPAALGP